MSGLPPVIEPIMNDYISLVHNQLPEVLEGMYLHGSIALSAYEHGSSDIDFIAVLNRHLTPSELVTLSDIHKNVEKVHVKPELDGVYILPEHIGLCQGKGENIQAVFFNEGELTTGEYFNFNPVTWYLFQEKGIAVLGEDISTYYVNVSINQVLSYVHDNMNTYWLGRLKWLEASVEEVKSLPAEVIESELEWSVLGLLRQYYTMEESDIISKMGAGEYGLNRLSTEWHSIVKEAMNIRAGRTKRHFNSNEERITFMVRFMRYLIHHCNEYTYEKKDGNI
ncbi:aminoglycoside adenylyltransferase domain-containing protein [Bacillus sp. KH172YL63]|uniref:aminoglycoside adenylyltransferase domain-containing protein n=1 Tax=Bacillus sp. KH172YL63 TaxID=2709784 RepID=UPI001567A5F6|nr:aminoglycoside adenylyltransferase domain-containing protein [Bacillus sp. KH172YL63]